MSIEASTRHFIQQCLKRPKSDLAPVPVIHDQYEPIYQCGLCDHDAVVLIFFLVWTIEQINVERSNVVIIDRAKVPSMTSN